VRFSGGGGAGAVSVGGVFSGQFSVISFLGRGIYLMGWMFVFGWGGGFWGLAEEKREGKLGEVVSFQPSVFRFGWLYG